MPDESEKSFEAALEIIKMNISEKKNQIANDSDGKLVGKLLPEVEALQVVSPSLIRPNFERVFIVSGTWVGGKTCRSKTICKWNEENKRCFEKCLWSW